MIKLDQPEQWKEAYLTDFILQCNFKPLYVLVVFFSFLLNSANLVAQLCVLSLFSLKNHFKMITLSYLQETPLLYCSSVLNTTGLH